MTATIYELLVIAKPFLDSEGDAAQAIVEQALKQAGATVKKLERLGRRRLPYDINKLKEGLLLTVQFEVPKESLDKLRRTFTLNEDILRATIVKLTTEDVAYLEVAAKQRAERRERANERGGERGGDRDRGGDRRGGFGGGNRGGGGFNRQGGGGGNYQRRDGQQRDFQRNDQQAPVADAAAN